MFPRFDPDLVWEVDGFLGHRDRAGARRHLAAQVCPVLARVRGDRREPLLQLAADLDAALA